KRTKSSRLRLLGYSLPALRCSRRKLALRAQTATLSAAPFRSLASRPPDRGRFNGQWTMEN
ncbi:hypothetical protein, partial [Parabacteroides sp. An277]|uniref:hypothetical protein n=1 Tax=Parabacteroides sp. An277 TaxID=1965619 RepID=UPI0019520BA5